MPGRNPPVPSAPIAGPTDDFDVNLGMASPVSNSVKRKRADTVPLSASRFNKFVNTNVRRIRRKLGGRITREEQAEQIEAMLARAAAHRKQLDEAFARMRNGDHRDVDGCANLERVVDGVLKEGEKDETRMMPRLRRSWTKLVEVMSRPATPVADINQAEATSTNIHEDRAARLMDVRLRQISNNDAWGTHGHELADEVRRDPEFFNSIAERSMERTEQIREEQLELDRQWCEREVARQREDTARWSSITRLFREGMRGANARHSTQSQMSGPSTMDSADPEEDSGQESDRTLCATMDNILDDVSIVPMFDNEVDNIAEALTPIMYDGTSVLEFMHGSDDDDEDSIIIIIGELSDM